MANRKKMCACGKHDLGRSRSKHDTTSEHNVEWCSVYPGPNGKRLLTITTDISGKSFNAIIESMLVGVEIPNEMKKRVKELCKLHVDAQQIAMDAMKHFAAVDRELDEKMRYISFIKSKEK